jgi:zinc transport system substrate-binding protein
VKLGAAFRAGHVLRATALAAMVNCLLASPAAADLSVTVTIKPIHALVSGVMAGVGKPALLVKGAASPHTYAMKPSDAAALNASDVFFRVSEAVEPFTIKVVKSLPVRVKVVTLVESPGLELLKVRAGSTFEGDHHDRPHPFDLHVAGNGHETRTDGHIWLDPENAKKMVAEIARVLAAASPEYANALASNAVRVTEQIDALERDLERDLAPVKDKPFLVFHDAYQYFERRFGLRAAGSVTASPDLPPSARRLSEIRTKISSLGATCVFAEPQFQPKLVDAVIEGTGARSGVLDPEGALLEPGPDAYALLMSRIAENLRDCLAHQN